MLEKIIEQIQEVEKTARADARDDLLLALTLLESADRTLSLPNYQKYCGQCGKILHRTDKECKECGADQEA